MMVLMVAGNKGFMFMLQVSKEGRKEGRKKGNEVVIGLRRHFRN